jgi:hypothetical protein
VASGSANGEKKVAAMDEREAELQKRREKVGRDMWRLSL